MMCDFENFIQLLQVHLVEHLNDLFLNFFFLHCLSPCLVFLSFYPIFGIKQ
uniref:Uncharacterized protein n=1 Tax=Myoviridae sp. ct8iP21 TaxID=2825041 RepID=A0A8S5V4H0_9CAUD|nr:MAG TPA: hypothetical protein [Myoviridae sp. ct8iP21]